jgi:hypothetical protein
MRRRVVIALLASVGAVVVGAMAAVSAVAIAHHNATVRIALPASGQGQVWELIVKEAPSKSASLHVSDANEAKLPPGIRAVSAVTSARSKKRGETVKLFVAINNLSTPGAARAAYDQVMVMDVSSGDVLTGLHPRPIDLRNDCPLAVSVGNSIDDAAKQRSDGSWSYGSYDLVRLQEMSVQPSPDEEVFDFTVYRMCSHYKNVESPDSGAT